MRLRTRFLVVLVVVAAILSAVSVAGFTLYRDATVDQERQDATRTSDSVARQLDVLFAEKSESVALWAEHSGMADHRTLRQRRAVRRFVAATRFDGASVIAANGTMTVLVSEELNSSTAEELEGEQFGDRRYFQRAMAGETYVSDPVAAESGNQIVTISTPIRRDGEVVGTFNAAFYLRKGNPLDAVHARADGTERITVTAGNRTAFAVGPDMPSDEVALVANATVERTGWTVSVARSDEAVASRLDSITLLQTGTLAVVVIALASLGGWLYREYVHNFEHLVAGFAALVDGAYGTSVDLAGSAEWLAIQDHFNELSETLARRRVEVAVLNRVLRHNLRNAMTVVAGNAEQIEREVGDERIAAMAGSIRNRADSLLRLADHARIVESSLRVDRVGSSPRPVRAVVEETVAAIDEEYPAATVRTREIPADVAIPDGELVAVVVDELVRNAVIHAERDPTVTVEVETTAETVAVTVADDGPGLPAIERKLLGGDLVETPTEHGSGLGLWVVRWIVDELDGDVSVAVDGGTSVTVRLPHPEE